MSPEQISGKQVDARTDIFSLGVVFHQLLTSHLPFEGETPAATLLKIMHERPRPVADYDPSFPSEIDKIILRALAKDREERYSSAQDLAFDLVQIRSRLQDEVVEEAQRSGTVVVQEELVKARDKPSEVLKIDPTIRGRSSFASHTAAESATGMERRCDNCVLRRKRHTRRSSPFWHWT